MKEGRKKFSAPYREIVHVLLFQPHASNELFAASKADNGVKMFGRILAIWLFVIAAFIPIAGAYVTLAGLCPMEDILRTLHSAKP